MSTVVLLPLLVASVCFLAYANGANDNFKGVASLLGSRTASYNTAILWATLTTLAGSVAAIFLAQSLLERFSGRGLVPDALTIEPAFILSVAAGAGATVILATLFGYPISTTHGLTGALLGAGIANSVAGVNFGALGANFLLPLLLAPLLAVVVSASLYAFCRGARNRLGVGKELCVCVGNEVQIVPLQARSGVLEAAPLTTVAVSTGVLPECRERYAGTVVGLSAGRLIDGLHFISAGAVSFARGLNDTPKIAALLLIVPALRMEWGLLTVGAAIAAGGLLHARKVAHTLALKITDMNPGQGFAANLGTALLVTTASVHGLPVSTTHVTVGSLLGIGITTGTAKWKSVGGILASWLLTLPLAALLAGLLHAVLAR